MITAPKLTISLINSAIQILYTESGIVEHWPLVIEIIARQANFMLP